MKPHSSPLTIYVFLLMMLILSAFIVIQFIFDICGTIRLLFVIKIKREFNLQPQGALFRLVPGTSMGSARMYMYLHGYKHVSKEEFSALKKRALVCIPSRTNEGLRIAEHSYSYYKPRVG